MTVIKVEKISKKYIITHQQRELYRNFRDVIAENARCLYRRFASVSSSQQSFSCNSKHDEFWALHDVSFDIQHGECVGIIGRNGAGKSTLLKILSRITAPTSGKISLKGRIASLLEVGTGFHPELTGRENIYLNGAILGMNRLEIKRKFDEIVAFSEVERFLDTPVKRFSSGMYVRLAFAVAAHLEPEILIVDEVLAVGDVQFQKKCLGKMEEVGDEGRTVLFVSHNMGAIRQLCSRSILLNQGIAINDGPTDDVINYYYSYALGAGSARCCSRQFPEDDSKEFQVLDIRMLNNRGDITATFDCDETVRIEMRCISRKPVPKLYGYLGIKTIDGTLVWVSDSLDVPPNKLDSLSYGKYKLTISVPARTLCPGEYMIIAAFGSNKAEKQFHVDLPGEMCTFSLIDTTTGRGNNRQGYFSTLLTWDISKQDN